MNVLTFGISGKFAAFKDPSVTSNQTVYHIPSKSAVVGLLGAMIGIERAGDSGDLYGEEYVKLFGATRIGMRFESDRARKVLFFTNHRSLKEPKTKPFKSEVLENPRYTIYVDTSHGFLDRLLAAVSKKTFAYPPYLGHAYCPATVSDCKVVDAKEAPDGEKETDCVVLDESETYDQRFDFGYDIVRGSVIIERHIHHFVSNGHLDGRVLKHWIPSDGSIAVTDRHPRHLSKFYTVNGRVVCMY